jgi:hypothetical protein
MEKMTAAACSQSECEGCEIQGKLLCVHKPKDLIDFYVLFMGWAIPFFDHRKILGRDNGMGCFSYHFLWLYRSTDTLPALSPLC